MAGALKSADDLVDFWVELMSRYPAIMVIIDPMRKQVTTQFRLFTVWCDMSLKYYVFGKGCLLVNGMSYRFSVVHFRACL